MPLFNESLESIAQAVVTVKRALKAGVIEKGEYKGLNDYLAKRAKDFKVKKSHLVQANKELDEELLDEELEFFVEEGDALYKMAEALLEEHEKDDVKAAACEELAWLDDEGELDEVPQDKQAAAHEAWLKMDDDMRATMAVLASNWQMGRALGVVIKSGK
jgi:transcriptional regulator